ncbi:uncharacterized protein [Temnothorax nylanderi]|uniref:uncharacterized protein n=1 Tax=Temnothorax nylanderi TaxID=102681 RepID=UPI003A8B1694
MEKINVACSFCGIVGSYKTILNHINNDHPDPETNNCESQAGCSNVQESQENSEVDETDNSKNLAEWSEGETKFLLDKYGQYMVMIGPMKQFKTKKTMWEKIAMDLKNIFGVSKTSLQCKNRYKTIMKRKKKAIDNNKSTGRSKMTVPYENELSGIVGLDDSIEPEVLMDAKHLVVNKKRILSNLGNETVK